MVDLDLCFTNNAYLKKQLCVLMDTVGDGCVTMLVESCKGSRNELVHIHDWIPPGDIVGIIVLLLTYDSRDAMSNIMDDYDGATDSQLCAIPTGLGWFIAKNTDHIDDVMEALDLPAMEI